MEKEKEKFLYQKTEVSPNNNHNNYSKISPSQKNDLELKRFNSHEVYLVTQKKPQNNNTNINNINPSKGNKKIYINISKANQDKIKPKSKKSFNTNPNVTETKTQKINNNKNMVIKTENNTFNKAKTKLIINPTINVNSVKKIQNIIKSNKIFDEESIKEIDSEGENTNSNKEKNYNENKLKEKNFSINNNNKIIKKINFDEIQTNNIKIDSMNRELLIISKKGDKEKLLDLLSSKQININFQNENGWSALHFACDEGNLKIAEILIKSKIDLNLKTNEKKTSLHISVFRGYFDISKLLIENGAKINLRDNEQNLPIHICASQGYDELLNFLLEKSHSGIKIKNLYGKTPLDLAIKESTKEIIQKFLNMKKMNNISNKDNEQNHNFAKIRIRKTNKNLMKNLMIPINQNQNVLNNNNNEINNSNDLKKTTSKNFNNDTNTNTNTILTSNLSKTINSKEKISTSSKKIFNAKNNYETKQNKLKIEISTSNKTSVIGRKNLSKKNNTLNNTNNTNSTKANNYNVEYKNIINNNNKYLNTTSNKHKTIFNIHISCNNTGNKSPSPNKDSTIHYNTSSNMTSSNKNISNNNILNNTKINSESKGNEIFFGEKEKIKGKIINIPKKIKNKKEDRSQSKNKKISSVLKTETQTDRLTSKFSPNIKYMNKYKKKNIVFKKEDSKIMNNNTSSKRTISVPRFLDTEYILEPQNKKQQFKKEESAINKFKVPKKNKGVNISNQNMKNKNKESINNYKGKVINNTNINSKNMKKQNSNKNKNKENIGIKSSQIYTDDGANLIDDLDEEETIIEAPKNSEKNKKENIVKNNKENNKSNKNANKLSINTPDQSLKKSHNMETNEDDEDIEELEDSFYSSDESDSNKNEKIGPSNFVCLALLGQGSFGEVYLVKKKDSNDFYAMKVLDKCRIAKQNIFKYVLTERNVLSVMNNPFIVKLNYAFQTSEKLFLLLDYCPGGDLSKQLQIQTRFSEEKAKFYICEIILALGELHKHNIIFRDLKPDNVVIDKEGHALLTDFGLSRGGVEGKDMAKSFCGSIAYLAPEMLSRTGHGKAVDWYLLGVLFYELLVGVPPYFTANQEQIFRNIQNAQLYIPPFISNKAANLIKSLLKRNPNERLGSKRDVEEIKENEYFADVDWQKVYERKYKPPQIYLKSNHLQFFRQPVQFKENEEDDLFVKDNNYDYNKYNQDILNSVNNYEGWSFVQKPSGEINNVKSKIKI